MNNIFTYILFWILSLKHVADFSSTMVHVFDAKQPIYLKEINLERWCFKPICLLIINVVAEPPFVDLIMIPRYASVITKKKLKNKR